MFRPLIAFLGMGSLTFCVMLNIMNPNIALLLAFLLGFFIRNSMK